MGYPVHVTDESYIADLDIGFNDVKTFAKDFPFLNESMNGKDFPHLDSKSYSVVGLNNKSLQEIVIPDYYNDGVHGRHPVTAIEGDAFAGCSIEKVVVPPTVIYLLNQAFDSCVCLTQINIPNSVERIHGHCFDGCISIKRIHLPIRVAHIGAGAFDGCRNLEIYTDHLDKPKGWSDFWNVGKRPVYWAGHWELISGVPTALKETKEIENG